MELPSGNLIVEKKATTITRIEIRPTVTLTPLEVIPQLKQSKEY
jgi:hypothetical protein